MSKRADIHKILIFGSATYVKKTRQYVASGNFLTAFPLKKNLLLTPCAIIISKDIG